MPANVNRRRRQKYSTGLDPSWILPADDLEGLGASPDSSLKPDEASISAKSDQSQAAEPEDGAGSGLPAGSLPASDGLSRASSRLDVPGPGDESSATTSNRGSREEDRVATTADTAQQAPVRPRKKRYATQHSAHWVEEDDMLPVSATMTAHEYTANRATGGPGAPHTEPYHHPTGVPSSVTPNAAPPSVSPSIFRPQGSSNSPGYDAPPISPAVPPAYSPWARG